MPPNQNQILTSNGDMYFKLSDRIVAIYKDSGTNTWYNKPTLKTAVADKRPGVSYTFYSDGSVTFKNPFADPDVKYMWSAAYYSPAYPSIEGTPLEGYFNSYTNTYTPKPDPIPCRLCSSDCNGSDYETWNFCSRRCMVECMED
jgi:hypothetical protein